MGHARALLPLPAARQTMLAAEIHARRMSVREAERLASRHMEENSEESERKHTGASDRAPKISRDVARIEERIADLLATRVQLRQGARGAGTLTVHFSDPEHFGALMARLSLNQTLED